MNARKWLLGRRDAVPPEDVRVQHAGGEIPVETVYVGRNREGLHVWEAAIPYGVEPTSMTVGMLPARTQVVVAFRWGTPVEGGEGEISHTRGDDE